MSSLNKIIKKSKELVNNRNFDEAYNQLKTVMNYPGQVDNENDLTKVMEIFKEIGFHYSGENFAEIVQQVIDSPNSINALYNLAYELYEQQLYGIAATILCKANKLVPENESIVSELCSCFEALFLNHEAVSILVHSPHLLDSSELCQYLYAFNSVMCGDLKKPGEILPKIKKSNDENIRYMASVIEGMVARADILTNKCALDEKDLRGWHMVLNGDILLHLSPFGINEGMNGRYAFVTDSYSLCKQGIERVGNIFEEAEIKITRIYHLPSRSSEILALAASKILGIPAVPWPEEGTDGPGLIIAYDLNEICTQEMYEQLSVYKPGQILWTHTASWTEPFPFAPDITTFLYQFNTNPWDGGGLMFDDEKEETVDKPAELGSNEDIANKIVEAETDTEYFNDLNIVITMVATLKELDGKYAAGIFNKSGRRLHQRSGSVVKSSMFI